MLDSLNKRFNILIDEDVFIISTVLDPNFGLKYFEIKKQDVVKARVLAMLKRSFKVNE